MRLAMQLPVCVSESDALMPSFPLFVQQFDLRHFALLNAQNSSN